MMLTTTRHPHTEISDLKAQISDLENQYAEIFLANDDREQLRNIHQRLEALKQKLKQKVRRRR